jgi:hypothetical protein
MLGAQEAAGWPLCMPRQESWGAEMAVQEISCLCQVTSLTWPTAQLGEQFHTLPRCKGQTAGQEVVTCQHLRIWDPWHFPSLSLTLWAQVSHSKKWSTMQFTSQKGCENEIWKDIRGGSRHQQKPPWHKASKHQSSCSLLYKQAFYGLAMEDSPHKTLRASLIQVIAQQVSHESLSNTFLPYWLSQPAQVQGSGRGEVRGNT